jgi:hypothetical protein
MNSSGSIHSAWSRVQKRKHGRGGVERNGMAKTESGDQHSVNHEMGTGPQTPARPTEFDCG